MCVFAGPDQWILPTGIYSRQYFGWNEEWCKLAWPDLWFDAQLEEALIFYKKFASMKTLVSRMLIIIRFLLTNVMCEWTFRKDSITRNEVKQNNSDVQRRSCSLINFSVIDELNSDGAFTPAFSQCVSSLFSSFVRAHRNGDNWSRFRVMLHVICDRSSTK